MKFTLIPGLYLLLCGLAIADVATPDPEAWYRDSYAPLWADKPGTRVEAMLAHYAETVETHTGEGEVSRDNKVAWLQGPIEQWLAEGWLKAELKALQTDRLNDSTVVFKASWLDSYQGGETELSCGWYLADYLDGSWQFTLYADIDCAAHGL